MAGAGPFRIDLPVRFADVDYARVMYFPRMLDLTHVAMEEFFARGVGKSYAVMVVDERIGFPTVHLECDFVRPLRFGDVAEVAIDVLEVGVRKVVFRYAVANRGAPAFAVRQTAVAIDPVEFRSIDIPPFYRDAFTRYRVAELAS